MARKITLNPGTYRVEVKGGKGGNGGNGTARTVGTVSSNNNVLGGEGVEGELLVRVIVLRHDVTAWYMVGGDGDNGGEEETGSGGGGSTGGASYFLIDDYYVIAKGGSGGGGAMHVTYQTNNIEVSAISFNMYGGGGGGGGYGVAGDGGHIAAFQHNCKSGEGGRNGVGGKGGDGILGKIDTALEAIVIYSHHGWFGGGGSGYVEGGSYGNAPVYNLNQAYVGGGYGEHGGSSDGANGGGSSGFESTNRFESILSGQTSPIKGFSYQGGGAGSGYPHEGGPAMDNGGGGLKNTSSGYVRVFLLWT